MGDEFKETVLEELGFSKNEIRVYLALTELGSTSIGSIAKKTKLHRTNVYDALKRLVEKGAASYILMDDKKIFQSSDPNNLMLILQTKALNLQKIIPELELARSFAKKNESFAAIYEGTKPFQNILDGFLKYEDPILVYGIPKEAPELMKTFIPHFHKRRISKKIPMKHIYNHNAKERIDYLNTLPHTEARCLISQYDSKASTSVCGDETVITLWTDPVFVVQIKNSHIANAYKHYFGLLWKDAVK